MKHLLVAAVASFACISLPAKAEFQAIDCGSTNFEFAEAAYHADCERSKDPIRTGGSSGTATTDVMSISNDDRTIFFTVLDRRLNAPHIYLEHRNLEEGFRSVFGGEGVRDWKLIGDKDGYEVAEFSRDISGRDSHCISVQRYSSAMYTGYKRHIIGMGCTVGDIEEIYAILRKVDQGAD